MPLAEGDIRSTFPSGMAWAARRKIIEGHGLYDAMIIGSGDRAMFHAMYGQFEVPRLHLNKPRQEHYLMWARAYHRDRSRENRKCGRDGFSIFGTAILSTATLGAVNVCWRVSATTQILISDRRKWRLALGKASTRFGRFSEKVFLE